MKRHLHVHLKSKFSEITFSLTALSDTHSCCSKVPIPARCTFKRTPAVCTVTGCWMNSSTKTNHLYGGSFSEALLKGRMNYTAFNHVTGTGLLGINWESKLFSCCLCSRPLWLTADELTGFFSHEFFCEHLLPLKFFKVAAPEEMAHYCCVDWWCCRLL